MDSDKTNFINLDADNTVDSDFCVQLMNGNLPDGDRLFFRKNGKEAILCGVELFYSDLRIPPKVIDSDDQETYIVTEIGDGAFAMCTMIESVVLPDTITRVGDRAFFRCNKLKNVSFFNVKTIGSSAFAECTCLQNITFPETVNYIGASAFRGCTALTKINLPSAYYIEDEIFAECTALETVKNYSGNTIGPYAFADCEHLQEIEITNTVQSIEDHSFSNCSSLKTIRIPQSVENIGWGAFEGSGLEHIVFPDSITEIEEEAFSNCHHLKSAVLSASIMEISSNLFMGCTRLTQIAIPEKVSIIKEYAFAGCSCLEIISLPLSLTEIATGAFKGCTRLREVNNMPASITLGKDVFEGCDNLDKSTLPSDPYESIADFQSAEATEITLPSDTDYIRAGTFADYGQLQKINIPKNVWYIEGGAFLRCFQLTEIKLNGNPHFRFEDGILYYTGKDQDEWSIVHVAQCPDDYSLNPKVTGVLPYAFAGIKNLASIRIPDGCLSIGNNAFEGCFDLRKVVVEGMRLSSPRLEYIAPNTFRDCVNLEKIDLPYCITTISDHAFDGCGKLKTIVLPTCLQFIGEGALANCSALKEITIPESVSEIHDGAFANCLSLSEVALKSSNVTLFGEMVFANCFQLNSINGEYGHIAIHDNVIYSNGLKKLVSAPCAKGCFKVPEFVETIGKAAFFGRIGLAEVVLPKSVLRIEADAFRECHSLKIVHLPGVRYVEEGAFTNCSSLQEIRIPDMDATKHWIERPRTDLLKVLPVVSKTTPLNPADDASLKNMTTQSFSIEEEELRKMSYDFNKRVVIQSVFQRNKQHNLGSHVNALFAHADFVKRFDPAKELTRYAPLFYQEKAVAETDMEVLLSKQIEYGNLRDSFCTDIMSGAPVTRSVITIRNLIKEFEVNRILLNYIAKDSFEYRFQVFFDDEQTPADPYPTKDLDTGESVADNRWEQLVSMPNDTFGCQAFYNFLENVIRNTAKYTNYKNDEINFNGNFQGVTICIRFKKSEDKRFYTVEIYSNVLQENIGAIVRKQNNFIQEPVVNPETYKPRTAAKGLIEMASCTAYLRGKDVIAIDSKDYKYIGDTLGANDERRNIYNEYSEPVFLKAFGLATEESIPKPEYASPFSALVSWVKKWGATVTRNQVTIPTYTVIDSRDRKHTCVHLSDMEVESKAADYYDGFLGYRFFLLKPEQVLVAFGNGNNDDNKKLAEQLAGHKGVDVVSVNELRTQLENGVPVTHDILVCDDKNIVEQYPALLPIRVLSSSIFQDNVFSNTSSNDSGEDNPVVTYCWEKWVEKLDPDIKDYNTTVNNSNDVAYFDDHLNSGIECFKTALEKAGYAEALSSSAQQHLPDYEKNCRNDDGEIGLSFYFDNIPDAKGIAHYRLLESVNTRVFIVDEHIKQESNKIPSLGAISSITFQEHWKKCRIDLPNVDLLWNSPETASRMLNIINNAMDSGKYAFILIHLELLEGVFELLYPADKEEQLCEYINRISHNKHTQMVFKSGRGIPGYLPASVRFIQQTSVENALVETKSKYMFTSLLYESRAAKAEY